MAFVIGCDGKALMPCHSAKARKLLNEKKATVKEIKPFTIQLTYKPKTEITQELTLGVDTGYANIGYSVVSDKKELICGEVKLLSGMSGRLKERSMYRRNRRQRLRYRAPRFDNRIKSKPKGWYAPSMQHKFDSHIKFIDYLHEILPISKINVEIANFDIQKIKNPDISGKDYQEGEQMGFWNTRAYVLHRDGHKCQNPDCTNTSETPILSVHHIKYESMGGTNTPDNLITLCSQCHESKNHLKGEFLWDWCVNKKKVRDFKDGTFMNSVQSKVYDVLSAKYNVVNPTYGYITKNKRINNGHEKTHYNDAFAIADGSCHTRTAIPYIFNQVRRNKRSLCTWVDAKYIDIRDGVATDAKKLHNGRSKRNKNTNTENLRKYRGRKTRNGIHRIQRQRYTFQPNDIVVYQNKKYVCGGVHTKKTVYIYTDNPVLGVRGNKPLKLKNGTACVSMKHVTTYKFNNGFVCE